MELTIVKIKKIIIWISITIWSVYGIYFYFINRFIEAGHVCVLYTILILMALVSQKSKYSSILVGFLAALPSILGVVLWSKFPIRDPFDISGANFATFSFIILVFSLVKPTAPPLFKYFVFALVIFGLIFNDLAIVSNNPFDTFENKFSFWEMYVMKSLFSIVFLMTSAFLLLFNPTNDKMPGANNSDSELITMEEKLIKLQKRFKDSEEVLSKAYIQLKEKNQQVILQNEELQSIQKEIHSQKEIIERQFSLLESKNEMSRKFNLSTIDLTKHVSDPRNDIEETLKIVCRNVADTLNIEYVSVWKLTSDTLSLVVAYDSVAGQFNNNLVFSKIDYPKYFDALSSEKLIVSNNVMTDQRTSEFNEVYFKPNNIKKLVDLPLFEEGRMSGIICCEACDNSSEWMPEEVFYIKSISDIVTIAFITHKLKSELIILAEKNNLIEEQNKILKSQKDEIKRINDFLEERVQQRTQSLNERNKKLTEYAFINSHLLRGPLARIMGLVNILEGDALRQKDGETLLIYQHLKTSCDELDGIVKKINQIVTEMD